MRIFAPQPQHFLTDELTDCFFILRWAVGDCLQKHQSVLSKSCADLIVLHNDCKDDINTHCGGKEYTNDLQVCLQEWTKPEALSGTCAAALPKKEVKEARTLSKEEKKKADARRKARKEAAKRVKKDL